MIEGIGFVCGYIGTMLLFIGSLLEIGKFVTGEDMLHEHKMEARA